MITTIAATQPKQLTYRETIEQELRALRRLRDKRLCYGPYYADGACCAIGALRAHNASTEPMDINSVGSAARMLLGRRQQRRFSSHATARCDIIRANEDFRPGDNSPEAQRARYDHMVAWCLAKLAQPQSVSA